jgi:hypothetical protein
VRAYQVWVADREQHGLRLFTQRLVQAEAEVVADRLRLDGLVVQIKEVIVQASEKEY